MLGTSSFHHIPWGSLITWFLLTDMSEETIPGQMTSREEEEDVETTCASTTGPIFMLDVTHSRVRKHTHASIFMRWLWYIRRCKNIFKNNLLQFSIYDVTVFDMLWKHAMYIVDFFLVVYTFFYAKKVHKSDDTIETNIDSYFGRYSFDILINTHPSLPSSPSLFTFLSFSNSFFTSISY